MTKLQGSYRMLNESIKHLQNAGIEIRFNSVVTKKNKIYLSEIINFAEHTGATEVRLLKLIKHGRANSCWDDIGVSEKEYDNAVLNVIQGKNKIRITVSGIIDVLPCRYNSQLLICPAGKNLIYVANDGNIFPCASVKKCTEYKIGNIKDRDIISKLKLFQNKMNGNMLCK